MRAPPGRARGVVESHHSQYGKLDDKGNTLQALNSSGRWTPRKVSIWPH